MLRGKLGRGSFKVTRFHLGCKMRIGVGLPCHKWGPILMESCLCRILLSMDKSLLEIFNHYETNLAGRAFIVYSEGTFLFSFSFQRSDFIHLAGIQHILKGTPNASSFRGINGVAAISCRLLTREFLQSLNGAAYGRNKRRLDLLDALDARFFNDPSTKLFQFDPANSPKKTLLPAGYVFLSRDAKSAVFFEVKKGRFDYIPASFFPCKPSIVDGQKEITGFVVK